MPPVQGKSPSRGVYADLNLPRVRRGKDPRRHRALLAVLVCALCLLAYLSLHLRALSSGTARSDAEDLVALRVSETIRSVLAEQRESGFVTLEKDAAGNITAVTTDTVRLNELSARLQMEIARAADNGQLDVSIPLGDLLGAGMVQGRGPMIPVRAGMMTSAFVRFENSFAAVGINQSRYSLTLVADVEIDLLIPWGSMHTSVTTEIPVAETVVLGRVPETYFYAESAPALPLPGTAGGITEDGVHYG